MNISKRFLRIASPVHQQHLKIGVNFGFDITNISFENLLKILKSLTDLTDLPHSNFTSVQILR